MLGMPTATEQDITKALHSANAYNFLMNDLGGIEL